MSARTGGRTRSVLGQQRKHLGLSDNVRLGPKSGPGVVFTEGLGRLSAQSGLATIMRCSGTGWSILRAMGSTSPVLSRVCMPGANASPHSLAGDIPKSCCQPSHARHSSSDVPSVSVCPSAHMRRRGPRKEGSPPPRPGSHPASPRPYRCSALEASLHELASDIVMSSESETFGRSNRELGSRPSEAVAVGSYNSSQH